MISTSVTKNVYYTPEFGSYILLPWGLPVALVAKNPAANAGDLRDLGFIPGLGRSLEKGMATNSSILAWRIQWTGKPGALQSIGLQRVRHD